MDNFYYWISTDRLNGIKNEAHWHFNFTNEHIKLNPNENWHVALISATLPSCIVNTAGCHVTASYDNDESITMAFPKRSLWSVKQLVEQTQVACESDELDEFLGIEKAIVVKYSDTTKRVSVTLEPGVHTVQFSPVLLSKLGFDSTAVFRAGERYVGLTIPDPFIHNEHYLFSSNMIQTSNFNESVMAVMDNFVIKFDERNTNKELIGSRLLNMYESATPKYMPVSASCFNRMELSILNEQLSPVQFCDEIGSLIFTFHFKKWNA